MLLLESVYYLVVSYFFVFQDITVFPDVGLSPGLCRLSALFLVLLWASRINAGADHEAPHSSWADLSRECALSRVRL